MLGARGRKILYVALLLIGVAAAGWWTWGSSLANQFDRQLAAHHDSGRIRKWGTLGSQHAGDGMNGWATLVEAAQLIEELEEARREADESGLWAGEPWLAPSEEPWTAAQDAAARRHASDLAPALAKIDEALGYPGLRAPQRHHGDPSGLVEVKGAYGHLVFAMHALPAQRGPLAKRLFTLLLRWHPIHIAETLSWCYLWRQAAVHVRDLVDFGRLKAGQAVSLTDLLVRAERRLTAQVSTAEHAVRSHAVLTLNAWRNGHDPYADAPAYMKFEPAESDSNFEGTLEDRAVVGLRPWTASWYGRPLFLRDALDVVNAFAASPVREGWTLAALRTVATNADEPAPRLTTIAAPVILRTAATLRLCRVRLALGGEVGAGGTSEARLTDLAAGRMGGSIPTDPMSGEPFTWWSKGGRWTVGCPESRVRSVALATDDREAAAGGRKQLEDAGLLWPIR